MKRKSSTSLSIGKFEIPDPCPVPWDEMQTHDGRNRHCLRCSKVVHDITGMSESEIERLYEANGGQICANISVDELGNPLYFKTQSVPRKPVYLKHIAAAASLLLIYHVPQAKPIARVPAPTEAAPIPNGDPIIVPTEKTNTLITGVVLNDYDDEIHDSLEVRILHGDTTVATLFTSNGLFHIDLADLLKPTDTIQVIVVAKTFNEGQLYKERKYGGTAQQLPLGQAQNMKLRVDYTASHPPTKTGGVMIRPSRLGG